MQLMGPMPTPAVAHLTNSMRADGGIVISASHNPHHDNGIKFFSAQGREARRRHRTRDRGRARRAVPHRRLRNSWARRCAPDDHHRPLRRGLPNSVPKGFNLGGMRIVVDCANGATYHQLGPLVLRELGARVDAIGVPATSAQHQRRGRLHPSRFLAARVRAGDADLGIAFDGDGDRVLFVDGGARRRRRRPAVRAGLRLAGKRASARAGGRHADDQLRLRGARWANAASVSSAPGRRPLRAPATAGERRRARRQGPRATSSTWCASTGDSIVSALQVLEDCCNAAASAYRRSVAGACAGAAEDGQRARPRRPCLVEAEVVLTRLVRGATRGRGRVPCAIRHRTGGTGHGRADAGRPWCSWARWMARRRRRRAD